MNEQSDTTDLAYINLKRISTIGFMVVLVWFSIGAGIMFLLSGDLIGWVSIAVGLFILAIPLTNSFRKYWGTGNSVKGFPLIVFAAASVLIFIYGNVFLSLLSDPFVFYNDQNAFSLYLWGGASILSLIALLADIGAYITDRRRTEPGLAKN